VSKFSGSGLDAMAEAAVKQGFAPFQSFGVLSFRAVLLTFRAK
jgi:hypothetical protein